ncbi:MAG: peptide-methionine (S)-S-oxide reductase MsrA [Vicinamibacteraceae bacterium]
MTTGTKTRMGRSWVMGLAGVAVAVAVVAAVPVSYPFVSTERGRVVPPPVTDIPVDDATTQVAVFAGGCFWGVQGVFQHVTGVTNAVSGYAGGSRTSARYETVGGGTSGHAEAVQVTYDPRQVSYGALLQLFFSVAHDPTELNRQGPDVGPQYRSTIFPADLPQAKVAKAYIDQLNAARAFDDPIVTTIEPDRPFYPAEDYHQDYLTLNPGQPYIAINDLPKIAELKRLFPARYRATPTLVRPRRG